MAAALRAALLFFDEQPAALAGFCVLQAPAGPDALRARCRELVQALAARLQRERGVSSSPASTEHEERAVEEVFGVVSARLLDPSREPLAQLSGELSTMLIRLGSGARRNGRSH